MTFQELISTPIGGKSVYILGIPASGKSFIANELYHKNTNHHLVHSDSYMQEDFKDSLYVMIDQMNDIPGNFILEGILAYRALRKVYELKLDHLKPDLIIEVQVPNWLQSDIYRRERPGKNLKSVKSFNLSLINIFNEWDLTTPDKDKPEIINFLNDWTC